MPEPKDIAFDPYHKWLGIPKQFRPPNFYQLLGISVGESDSEVIEEASIRQCTHLRSYQMGPQAELCTKLLNQIGRARQVLLDPVKRAEYDRQLANQARPAVPTMVAQPITAIATPIAPPNPYPPQPTPFEESPFDVKEGEASPPSRRAAAASSARETRSSSTGMIVAIVACAGVAIVAVVVGLLLLNSGSKTVTPVAVVKKPAVEPAPRPPVEPPPLPTKAVPVPVKPPVEPPPPPVKMAPKVDTPFTAQGFKLIKRFNNIEPFDTFTAMRNGSIAYGNGQSLKVLDPASRKIGELKWGGASGQVFAASPMDEDAIVLLTTEKRTLVQLRYRTGEVVKKYAYANEPVALTMASGGNRFWVASRDGALMAFDPNIPLPAEFCRLDAFGSVLLATPAEGEFALCADGKKLTAVWSPEKIIDFNLPPVAPLSLAVTPDGKSVLVGSSEGLHTADIPKNVSGKKLSLAWSSSAPRDAFHHLIMAPNGRFLASANETEVFAWDWPSLKLLGQTTAPGKVKSLAIASDSRSMSFGDATNQLTIVSVPAGDTVVAKIDPSKPEASKPEKSMPETPKSETPKVPAAAPMVKLDIPPADKIAEATKVIREQFAKEYTVAKKVPAERASLAEKFVRLARETTDDAVARYVLLTEARDLANKWSQVEEALDLLGSEYAVEPIDLRLAALRVFLKTATTKESAEETCESIFDSANECFANDRFDTARSFLTLGIAAAAKAQKATFQSQFAKFDKELKGAELDYERMQKAKTVLANGDDEAAHLEVGRYLVFRKNDLGAGLAHLAKGGPDDLPEAARKDLTNPDDAKKQQDAGDAWWRLAEKAKGGVKNVYLSRAGHWYQKAAAKATGLSLAVINDRLKTIEDSSVVVGGGDSGNAEVRSFKGHRGAVLSLVVAADGRRIYSGGADGTIRSWDIATGRQLSSFNAGFQVASFEFSIDQRYLLTYDGSTARTWSTAKIPKILQAVESIIVPNWQDLNRFVTVNSNNSLATNLPTIASSSGGFLSNVKIRLTEPFPRARLFLVGNEIYMIDRTLSIPRAVRLPTPDATNVAMYPLQNSVILAGVDKTIQKYSFGADKITATYPGLTEIPRCLIVSESGKRIAAGGGSEKTVTIWDADTEAVLGKLPASANVITAIAFLPGDRQMISAGTDGLIRLWNLPREKSK